MNWLESLIYGLISGLTDILPISSQAHQQLMLQFFGQSQRDYVRDLFVHIALFLAVYTGCRTIIDHFHREQSLYQRNRRNARGSGGLLEMRVLKNAAIPMVLGIVILSYILGTQLNPVLVCLFLLINGFILFAPDRMMQGNKDQRFMSGLDCLLLGFGGALSMLTGISRTGAMLSVLTMRGVRKNSALNWVLLLSIPALATMASLDLLYIIFGDQGMPFWASFGGYILSFVGTFLGARLGIFIMKSLSQRSGYTGFAFYSWGVALFMFILYLTVV